MRRSFISLLLCGIICFSAPLNATSQLPKVAAKGAVLIEQSSGRILFAKDADAPLPMASTTKIMTCILAIEEGKMDDIVTTSKRASVAPPVKLHLQVGEKQRLGDLLYALMLQSDNDVAVAIAEHIGGSVEAFCELMTAKAKAIGAMHTTFKTPNGLDAEGHGSTAYDMALIGAYAMNNPEFVKIVTTQNITIPTQPTENSKVHDLQCKNRFVYSYQGANGIKTGFTNKAGHCFVGAAKKGEMQLVAVALGSGWGNRGKTQKYADVIHMMDYGFSQYQMVEVLSPKEGIAILPVTKAIEKEVTVDCKEMIRLPLNAKEKENVYIKTSLPEQVVAPIDHTAPIGTIEVVCEGVTLAKAPLYPHQDVCKASLLDHIKNWIKK